MASRRLCHVRRRQRDAGRCRCPGTTTRPLKSAALTLDNAGGGKASLTGIPKQDTAQQIVAELEYSDPNGEVATASTRIPVWPANLVVGLKPDSWALSKDKVRFQALVLDLTGKPVQQIGVKIDLFERKTFSHRKRLIGGFYAYQSGSEVVRLKTVCEGRSDAKGLVFCEFASPVSGEVLLQASATDAQGNVASTHSSVWIAGSGEWWFDTGNDDRMDLLPGKEALRAGRQGRVSGAHAVSQSHCAG